MPETIDKNRAKRLLETAVENAEETDRKALGLVLAPVRAASRPRPENTKRNSKVSGQREVPFTQFMQNMRNELFMDPFDEFDPHHRITGRKPFASSTTRCLQSRITLKFPDEQAKQREREKIFVKQEFLDRFNADYSDMCDNKKMNRKHRGVSKENPFEEKNIPPSQYLIPEKILAKPGAINNLS